MNKLTETNDLATEIRLRRRDNRMKYKTPEGMQSNADRPESDLWGVVLTNARGF